MSTSAKDHVVLFAVRNGPLSVVGPFTQTEASDYAQDAAVEHADEGVDVAALRVETPE